MHTILQWKLLMQAGLKLKPRNPGLVTPQLLSDTSVIFFRNTCMDGRKGDASGAPPSLPEFFSALYYAQVMQGKRNKTDKTKQLTC